jgi:lipopolysaccharide O-acetyltransferase
MRGKKYIDCGEGLTTGRYCRLDAFPEQVTSGVILQIGRNVQINDSVHITAIESVKIHDHVLIASKVFISDHNHGYYGQGYPNSTPESIPAERALFSGPVVIEECVWIGEGVAILPGVTIGSGSIIGANSVVCHSIPSHCIAVGVPARVIKRFNYESHTWEKA